MSTLPKITVNVDEMIGVNKYSVDEGGSHIAHGRGCGCVGRGAAVRRFRSPAAPKARHVAYAAICVDGDGRVRERMSDDGEPSGTAGKPILDVLRQGDLMNCAVTVTRYFGGILLGSGG
mgnify:CR=1 FL=1